MRRYPMIIDPLADDDGGGYIAYFVDLPGCMSDGETPEEAARNAFDALESWMEVQTERAAEIPAPGSARAESRAHIDALAEERDRLARELEGAQARIRELERARTQAWPVRSYKDDDRLYA